MKSTAKTKWRREDHVIETPFTILQEAFLKQPRRRHIYIQHGPALYLYVPLVGETPPQEFPQ